MYNCTQLNLRKSGHNQTVFLADCVTEVKNIICISEISTRYNKLIGLPKQCNAFFSGRKPRAAIVTKDILARSCPQFSGPNIQTIQAKLCNDKITYIVLVYMDGQIFSIPDELTNLLKSNNGKHEVLICSDTNSHASLWNCSLTDKRGDMVEDLVKFRELFTF